MSPVSNLHCVSKKFPPLNSLKLCQILTDFQNFCTAGKRIKFAIKSIWHYPFHLRYVATLPWKIKNSNFLQIYRKMQSNCILIASNFVIHSQILILSVFKIASISLYWLQIKFAMSQFFYLLMFAINICTWNSSQQTSQQCLSGVNMVFSDEDKILIKSLYLKGYTAKRMTDNFLRIKIGALKMQFVCNFFHICWISAENLSF